MHVFTRATRPNEYFSRHFSEHNPFVFIFHQTTQVIQTRPNPWLNPPLDGFRSAIFLTRRERIFGSSCQRDTDLVGPYKAIERKSISTELTLLQHFQSNEQYSIAGLLFLIVPGSNPGWVITCVKGFKRHPFITYV